MGFRPVLKAVPIPAVPRTPAVYRWLGTSLLGFINRDPKASRTLKSVNGLYWFEAIATTGSHKCSIWACAVSARQKFGFIYQYLMSSQHKNKALGQNGGFTWNKDG